MPREPRGPANDVLIFSIAMECVYAVLVGVICRGDDVLEGFEDGRCGLGGCTDDG